MPRRRPQRDEAVAHPGPQPRRTSGALAGSEVPPPPESLTEIERSTWTELAVAVEAAGVYSPPMLPVFRLSVAALALALDPALPGTVRSRSFSTAGKLLGTLGLRPDMVGRVAKPEPRDAEAARLRELLG